MILDHGTRDHARWSASSTARNWRCSGALALARYAPPEKESIHAATGTAVHQLSERCLRTGADPFDFEGTIEKTKQRDIDIGMDECESAAMYVSYVRERVAEGGELQIEQRFKLDALNTPFDAGGTGDAVIYYRALKLLEVVDLKNGMGIVDVNENKQLRTYGLGAALANPDMDIDTIKVTIVQPRAPHEDGKIRSESFDMAELIEWTSALLGRMKLSKQAEIEMDAIDIGDPVAFNAWADKWLTPGSCAFCPNAPCPAQTKLALAAADVWLDKEQKAEIKLNPATMSPQALGKALDMIPMLEDWVKAIRGRAHNVAEGGIEIPGWQLAEKIGNRVLGEKNEKFDEATTVALLRDKLHFTDDEIFAPRKVRTVAQLEIAIGKDRKDLLTSHTIRPVKGTNLVSSAKTTRPAVKAKADRWLETEADT